MLQGTAEPDGERTRITLAGISLYAENVVRGSVSFAIRSDRILVTVVPPSPPPENCIEGRIVNVSPRGPYVRIDVRIAPTLNLVAFVPQTTGGLGPGVQVQVSFPAAAVRIFDGEDEPSA